MTTLKLSTHSISRLFEIFICVFYTWYFLPICNALFWTNFYKLLFFSCFAIGTVGLLLLNNFHLNKVTIAVVSYLVIFTILYIFDIGDSYAHIRVSFTFWGTALLYFGILNDEERIRIGKYLFILCILTFLTSSIGVITNNSAARTIAHAAADDALQAAYKMMNISSVYLFQCSVFFVPILICLPKTPKAKVFSALLLITIFFVLLNASFTISLIVFLIALFFSLLLKETQRNRIIAIIVLSIIVLIVLLNGYNLLSLLGEILENDYISVRMYELRDLLYAGQMIGDAGMRWEMYTVSVETFLKNIFGVGVHYSYRAFENGIGYHSQFLDDLARYGMFALMFYTVFLTGYYKHLKNAWRDLGYPQIATVITIIYFVFLVLNLGFRSADESIVVLFIIPVMPLLIKTRTNK